jgi:hypothetical protein
MASIQNLTDTQIILSAVGNGIASGVSPQAMLIAISHSFIAWEIDAAICAAIRLHEIQTEEKTNGYPTKGNKVAG